MLVEELNYGVANQARAACTDQRQGTAGRVDVEDEPSIRSFANVAPVFGAKTKFVLLESSPAFFVLLAAVSVNVVWPEVGTSFLVFAVLGALLLVGRSIWAAQRIDR